MADVPASANLHGPHDSHRHGSQSTYDSGFQRRTFAVTCTGRLLRRMFTIVGEERVGTKKAGRGHAHVADAQSPPWWQCLTLRCAVMP